MYYICGVVYFLHVAKVRYKTHKNKNMKRIKVTPEERKGLQERFHVGGNYMMDVLAFRKDGPTARKIRRAALGIGGRYVDPDFAPNCRTSYLGGMIIQQFADQVVLRIDKSSGDLTLEHRGCIVDIRKNASMAEWESMAIKAQCMAEDAMVAR